MNVIIIVLQVICILLAILTAINLFRFFYHTSNGRGVPRMENPPQPPTYSELTDINFLRHQNNALQEEIQCIINENKELEKAFIECTEENKSIREELQFYKQKEKEKKEILELFNSVIKEFNTMPITLREDLELKLSKANKRIKILEELNDSFTQKNETEKQIDKIKSLFDEYCTEMKIKNIKTVDFEKFIIWSIQRDCDKTLIKFL